MRNATLLRVTVAAVCVSVVMFPYILYYSSLSAWTSQPAACDGRGGAAASVGGSPRFRSADPSSSGGAQVVAELTLDRPPPDSPYQVLHTVTTRFMVGQPNHPLLARARFLLFETFCWPTMRYQTNQNYYWLVLVDPRLDATILHDMEALLNKVPTKNAFMVLTSNTDWVQDGIGVENATSYGVGLQTVAEEFRDGRVAVVTGNVTHLHRALDVIGGGGGDGRPILVVETLLDADDGLNNRAVEWIQELAIAKAREQQRYARYLPPAAPAPGSGSGLSLNSTWWLLCGTSHIEWHNRDVFTVTKAQYEEFGISSGLTGLRTNPYFCTSAGFTRIGLTTSAAASSASASLPRLTQFPNDALGNHAIAFYSPPCTGDVAAAAAATGGNVSLARCYRRVFPGQPFIVKSRSITSDSMENMNPKKPDDYRDVAWLNKTQNPLMINETEMTWDVLRTDFSIDRLRVWEISLFLYENRQDILEENMASRCAPGFPCNKGARKNLVNMVRSWTRQGVNATAAGSAQTLLDLQRRQKQRLAFAELKKNKIGPVGSDGTVAKNEHPGIGTGENTHQRGGDTKQLTRRVPQLRGMANG